MFKRLHRIWLRHVLRRSHIPYELWHEVVTSSPVLSQLNHNEQHRLRKLSCCFLHKKIISTVGDLEFDLRKRVVIASQACLLILNLDLSYFRGWHEIIVYPGSFIIDRNEIDSSGVVHRTRHALSGEAWLRGPVILSWSDAQPGTHTHSQASNVIIHEFAHKLDMLNGAANGMPPLHSDMIREKWTESLSHAYDKLYHQIERHHHTSVDAYAVESPAEFFAVLSEVFFERPALLHKLYPQVYHQLSLFYRQNPLQRQANGTQKHHTSQVQREK